MADTSTTSTSSLLDPYLKSFLNTVQSQYQNGVWDGGYQGETVTPFSSQTLSALGGIQDIAQQPNWLNTAAMGATGGLLNGTQWDQLYNNAGNDAFGGVLDTQAGKLTDDISRQFSVGGRYGSAAHSGTIADQVGDFRSKAASDQFNQSIANQANILNSKGQQQLGAAALTPTLYGQQYAGLDRLASVGAQYENLDSQYQQQELNRYNQSGPLAQLQAYGGLLGMGTGGGTTSTVSSPTNYASQAAGYLGAASSGYGLLSSILGSGGSAASTATGLLW